MTIRRLIAPLSFAVVVLHAGHAFAQGAFPGPPLGQATDPASNASPAPPVNGAAPSTFVGGTVLLSGRSMACMTGFGPLREEAVARGKLIKVAAEGHAPPDEACKLIKSFSETEIRVIRYVESHATKCGLPPQISDQLKSGHKNTDAMQKKVCQIAQQMQQQKELAGSVSDLWPASKREPGGPVGDFWIIR